MTKIIDTELKMDKLYLVIKRCVEDTIASQMVPDTQISVHCIEDGDSDLLRECFDAAEIRLTSGCPFGRLDYYLGITTCEVAITHMQVHDNIHDMDELAISLGQVMNRQTAFRYVTLLSVRKMHQDGMLIGIKLILKGRFIPDARRPARSRLPVGNLTKADFIMFGPHNDVEVLPTLGDSQEVRLRFKFNNLDQRSNQVQHRLRLYGLDMSEVRKDLLNNTLTVKATVSRRPSVLVSVLPSTPATQPNNDRTQGYEPQTAAELLTSMLTDKEHELMVNCLLDRANDSRQTYMSAASRSDYDMLVRVQRITLELIRLFDKVFPGGHDILLETLGNDVYQATLRMAKNEEAGPDRLDELYEEGLRKLMG